MARSAIAAVVCVLAVGGVPGAQPLADPGVTGPAVTGPVLAVPATAPEAVPVVAPGAGSPRAPRAVAVTDLAPDERAGVAVDAALAQIGLPYVWGGDGPAAGDTGFDCSGLTRFAYAAAGIDLPRTAHTQYHAGPRVPGDAPLRPGDLVFYGVPERVHHVGLYVGDGRMVNAPRFGKPVQVAYHRWPGDSYLGATRPAAAGTRGLLPSPPAPIPLPIPVPEVFDAPPAPLPDGLRLPTPVAGPEQLPDPVVSDPGPTAAGQGTVPADPLPAASGAGDLGAPVPSGAAAAVAAPRSAQTRAPSSPTRPAGPPSVPDPLPTADPASNEPARDDDTPTGSATVFSLPAGEVEIVPVPAGPDGLPSGVGVTGGVVRVPADLLVGLASGASAVRTGEDGSTPLTVRSVELLTAAEAATRAGSGPVLVAPSGTGRWHVAVLG